MQSMVYILNKLQTVYIGKTMNTNSWGVDTTISNMLTTLSMLYTMQRMTNFERGVNSTAMFYIM